jgi:hypothetical protein
MRRVVLGLSLMLAASACSGNSSPHTQASATSTQPQQLTAAEQVRACEQSHHLSRAHQVTHPKPSSTDVFEVTRFESCTWPPGKGSDPDGYAMANVDTRRGPGQNESTDATTADVLSGTCQLFLVSSEFGSQGDYRINKPIEVEAGDVAMLDGQPAPSDLGFYPSPDEAVILRNSNNVVTNVSCI